ncbi:hypothetical protein B0H13DRAFT_1923823 [Mycena leptocephala]|nr:hypothetical protein B0H13DRAFT_1923823 [Mycena leptocephala]
MIWRVASGIGHSIRSFSRQSRSQTPILCEEKAFIKDIFNNVAGNKHSGMIIWQAMQMEFHGGFVIKWDNISICIVQIAHRNNVWLLNMTRIRDCGLMVKLLLTEKYKETSYMNVSLVQSIEDMFQCKVDKEEQTSNWKGDANSDITDEQKKYKLPNSHVI